ncbi:hypothetical protein RM190_04750 [Paracoccus sp. CPCC 101403]|uniref:Uncharacterized protein n=1 Tax=Paracoccus broussonetiae TaxID=3075834 RepID=A0ABU3EAB4_9RHOB|nr:hypothetical protein [Paracoccus sp. CPCC 101403]MDT1061157.1 hypothetical protein [Paracoccus sp. CPCC 101403]
MGTIEKRLKPMYFAPTKRQHYASMSAAARAEANTLMFEKYPSYGNEPFWAENERLCRVRDRLMQRIIRRSRLAIARKEDTDHDHR